MAALAFLIELQSYIIRQLYADKFDYLCAGDLY